MKITGSLPVRVAIRNVPSPFHWKRSPWRIGDPTRTNSVPAGTASIAPTCKGVETPGMIGRADQKPGRDAHVRFEQLRSELDSLELRLGDAVETGGERQ